LSKILAAVGSSLVLSLALAAPVTGSAARADGHVQNVEFTILPGDRIVEPNVALAPELPVRLTVTNTTHEFHTFTLPGLGISRLILPAGEHGARKTTFTFTLDTWGPVAWYCVICPSGKHGGSHKMGGTLYVIVGRSATP
jgi:hypothetical protein